MPSYTSHLKRCCTCCGVEMFVCALKGCQCRNPGEPCTSPNFTGFEKSNAENHTAPESASPSQQARILTKSKITPLRKGLAVTKKRKSPIIRGLKSKLKLVLQTTEGSSVPVFKAVILREMIRLGRQPNLKFKQAARRVRPFLNRCNEVKNSPADFSNQVQMQSIVSGDKIKNVEESESGVIKMTETPTTSSSEPEVQIHDQNLGNFCTPLESPRIDMYEADVLDKVDSTSEDEPEDHDH
ncbi:uncharacterized protein LOC108043468 isoform X1 [Drosophila rhopaloa]|uniref:Uncharacterized protein LOC108043468 isoform X1 n=1 Tax=Drosophila rhopaloa TaxID=1041015 RepID=A0A6P4EHJ1_DRORH|nr:uncharacterized protein LOC108043468 isoform X1 [Drosophila rhopaloa]